MNKKFIYNDLSKAYYKINNEISSNENEEKSFLTKSSDDSGSKINQKNTFNNNKANSMGNTLHKINKISNNSSDILSEEKNKENKNKINKDQISHVKVKSLILSNNIDLYNGLNDQKKSTSELNTKFNLINYSKNLESGYANTLMDDSCEFLLISNRYKILFCVHKVIGGSNKLNVYCLRNNNFLRNFCVINSVNITEAKLLDKRDLILLVTFSKEIRQTNLLIYTYNNSLSPLAKINLSDFLEYSYMIRTINLVSLPSRFYGRASNHGTIDGDLIIFGTSKGDIIFGKIFHNYSNGNYNKPKFEILHIYKLKNKILQGDEISNNFEISFINYDLFFDMIVIGDYSSNVRVIEKVLQIGKNFSSEENLPFFSLFYEAEKFPGENSKKNKINYNGDLPFVSITHDILKDRSIVMFDQGKDLLIETNESDEDF